MALTGQRIATLIRALNDAGVRYLVVGGLAVIAHGYVRLTTDIDLVFDLEPGNARLGMRILTGLGYRPKAPVPAESFADAALRQSWIEDKDMVVFSMWHPDDALIVIDCFIQEPFSFADAWKDRLIEEVAPQAPAPFVDLRRLLAMKLAAGRPKDIEDVDALRILNQVRDA